jgi:hypothetical protein
MPLAANCSAAWHAGTKAGIVQDSLAACGFETRAQIIWAKNNFAIGPRPLPLQARAVLVRASYRVSSTASTDGSQVCSSGWSRPRRDIVCLQQLKAPDEKFPPAAIRAAGYGAIWRGQKSWNDVAILARGADPTETRRGLPGHPRRYE